MYRCEDCGHESRKWFGRCPGCGNWNTLIEEIEEEYKPKEETPLLFRLPEINIEEEKRISSGISEFDSVLGGGIVPGSLILIGGDPGIGKSTLLLQVASNVSRNTPVLYISGEESISQIKLRADRLCLSENGLYASSYSNITHVVSQIEEIKGIGLIIIDSIQAVYHPGLESSPGTVSQIKVCTGHLTKIAKGRNIPIFIVGHVTKEGSIAGPKLLEHMVDCVLYFEGDKNNVFRILRAVKNRFGGTNEIAVFRMEEQGLIEVKSPSEAFLSERPKGASGSIVSCSIEGTRPILVEIQALTTPTIYGMARRDTLGVNYNRVLLLLAVLEKRMGYNLGTYDLFVNVAGGINVSEPACDLGICSAIVSSFKEKSVDEKTVLIGEVGLSGEIRGTTHIEKRVEEAKKLGFTRIFLPKINKEKISEQGLEIVGISNIVDVLTRLFP
ncbi:TPA: DNA repair protein RadA [bacterium]|nr:DNA repair protein RadA [bacterium]